jgi:hypothetical protein
MCILCGAQGWPGRFAAVAAMISVLVMHADLGVAASVAGPPMKTGVSVGNILTWGRTNPERTEYLWPIYEGREFSLPIELLRKVKAYDFDFVRLTVDPGPFLSFTGSRREALDAKLVETIKEIQGTGLDVLVDFHPIRMMKNYAPDHLESESQDGVFTAYVDMVRRTAHLLSGLDLKHVAIEPMNEPQLGYDLVSQLHWQSMVERLYDAVREESADLTIVVTGGRGGNIDGLVNLNPQHFRVGDIRYSFHYYVPYVFTMQGANDKSTKKQIGPYVTNLPYPAKSSDLDVFWPTVQMRLQNAQDLTAEDREWILKEAHKELAAYFGGYATRGGMSSQFDRVSEWARINGIRSDQIFLGEFDASQQGPSNAGGLQSSRLRWLADVRGEAERRGFHWCFWGLSGEGGDGMVLVSVADQTRIDVRTAAALGKSLYIK